MFGLTKEQIDGVLYYAKETYTTWWISERIKKDWNVNVSPKSIGVICKKHDVKVQTNKAESKKYIQAKIPNGFMNCGVTVDNIFVADTNDSANWDNISFPLPKPKYQWAIHSYVENNIVVLVDYKM